jgi:glucan endo-1,3-beta-D-glucosidase
MRFTSSLLASVALLATAEAANRGFNYGAQFANDAPKKQVDFEYEFNAAKHLPGTDGWTSARLYTMIQHGTSNQIIEAIEAAINTQTTLLLGMWASAGEASFNNEVSALKAAIKKYGNRFTDLVVGISVGSEDLYRDSQAGVPGENPGAHPDQLVKYIKQTRDAIRGTPLQNVGIGHVDTWQVYLNGSTKAVVDALDWVGMDAYPYFQKGQQNSVEGSTQLFFDAYEQTCSAVQKPVWVTETGWPVTGETNGQAVPGTKEARIFWEDVVCPLVRDDINLYYYLLQDVQYGNPSPSFGIKPAGDLNQVQPLYDLSCPVSLSPPSLT